MSVLIIICDITTRSKPLITKFVHDILAASVAVVVLVMCTVLVLVLLLPNEG